MPRASLSPIADTREACESCQSRLAEGICVFLDSFVLRTSKKIKDINHCFIFYSMKATVACLPKITVSRKFWVWDLKLQPLTAVMSLNTVSKALCTHRHPLRSLVPLRLGQKNRRAAVGACTPPTRSELNWEDGPHRKSQVSAFSASFQVCVCGGGVALNSEAWARKQSHFSLSAHYSAGPLWKQRHRMEFRAL